MMRSKEERGRRKKGGLKGERRGWKEGERR